MSAKGSRPKPAKDAAKARHIGPEARTLAMSLLAEGYSVTAVGVELGVDRETVRNWRDSPEGQEELIEARKIRDAAIKAAAEEARGILKAGAVDAARTLVELARSGPAAERIRASATILDRVGVPRTERIETAPEAIDLSGLSDEEFAQFEQLSAKARKKSA